MNEQFDISTSQIFSVNEESPLSILYDDYTENPKSNNPKVLSMTTALRKVLQQRSGESIDDILDRVSLLCAEYQREGFFAGVRIGIKLINEINR